MPKVKRQVRSKKYQFNKNRKRLRDKLAKTGTIAIPGLKKVWEQSKSAMQNIDEMGLVYNPNSNIPSSKQERIKIVKLINGVIYEEEPKQKVKEDKPKQYVVDYLEKDAGELRESRFRLPNGQIKLLTYYMDKYKRNYKEMSKDIKNIDQSTWKQLRAKVRKFMKIPEQFSKYEKDKNINFDDPEWQEYFSDSEV